MVSRAATVVDNLIFFCKKKLMGRPINEMMAAITT